MLLNELIQVIEDFALAFGQRQHGGDDTQTKGENQQPRAGSAVLACAACDCRFTLPPGDDRRFDVVGLGQNSLDLLVRVPTFPTSNSKHPIHELVWLPGGQVASAMVGCARLGLRACYIGRFGDDHLADRGKASLESEGVTMAATTIAGARSRSAVILVDARTGDRTVLWDRDARLAGHADDVPADVVAASRVLLVDCDDVEAATRAAEIARAHGVVTVVDVEAVVPGVERLLTLIDVIITSEGFPEQMTGEPDARTGARGARPTLQARDGLRHARPARQFDACQRTAADDARHSRSRAWIRRALGMPSEPDSSRRWFRSGPDDTAGLLRHANAVAALACRAHGARDGLPRADEVSALLATSVRT